MIKVFKKKRQNLELEKEITKERLLKYKKIVKELDDKIRKIDDKINAIYFQERKHDALMKAGVENE